MYGHTPIEKQKDERMYRADPARLRLGRIRCLTRSVQCMKKGEPLPEPICFVPKELRLKYEGEGQLAVLEQPNEVAKVLSTLTGGNKTEFFCAGRPLFNSHGGWVRAISPTEGWVLVQPTTRSLKGAIRKVPVVEGCEKEGASVDCELTPWLRVVEQSYSLSFNKPRPLENFDEDEMRKLQTPPPGWSLEADEELAQFLARRKAKFHSGAGTVKGSEYFVKIDASSEEGDILNILDSDLESFWETDGNQGQHWLRFHIKPGTVIHKFSLLVDAEDGNYLPKRVVVKAGSPDQLSVLHTHNFGLVDYETGELQLLPVPLDTYKEVIEVCIRSCHQDGIDARVRGVSVIAHASKELFPECEVLSEEDFSADKITCYPKLQAFDPKQLLHRGLVLKRIARLLDEDLLYVLPHWQPPASTDESSLVDAASTICQLWPLSKKRDAVIREMLTDTATTPPTRPVFFINRMIAKEHQEEPLADPSCKKTVFCQVIRETKKHTKPLTYHFRWAGQMSQWWECKFIQEGLVDLGGGFRDSLVDMAEELCPSGTDSPVALPLFIRSPNQSQDSSNAYRDAYIPDPSCTEFSWYRFVGQLMGAMVRSQESLSLSLPPFLWKELVKEAVTWERDFVSVDSAEVRLIGSIETMTKEKFDSTFAGALTFTAVLSNGDTVPLLADGESLVTYEDRLKYCRLAKEVRMTEFRAQIGAIRDGLIRVVPDEVLRLLTWQELETKVCGNPEISIEDLKKSTRYNGGLKESSPTVTKMWQALEKFSNDERSRFLRFITGRRRLPCTIFIDTGTTISKLPSSATCSNTLYLPEYDSVDEAIDRLKYAAYNCVAIDTDMSPYTMD